MGKWVTDKNNKNNNTVIPTHLMNMQGKSKYAKIMIKEFKNIKVEISDLKRQKEIKVVNKIHHKILFVIHLTASRCSLRTIFLMDELFSRPIHI